MIKKLLTLLAFICSAYISDAQNIETLAPSPNADAKQKALHYLTENKINLKLTDDDVNGLNLQDSYITQHNGLTHLFFEQTASNIPLFNGIVNVSVLPSGEILFVGNRALNNLSAKINTTQAVLTPEQAVQKACEQLKISLTEKLVITSLNKANSYSVNKGSFVLSDVNIELKFQKIDENHARLAWDLNLDKLDGSDHWSVRVDALDGKILNKNSWTTHCKVAAENFSHVAPECVVETLHATSPVNAQNETLQNETLHATSLQPMSPMLVGGGSYNVFALPLEAPTFGARTLVTDPANASASPYGWHDTNGVAGAEYTITQGNNVHAYLDTKNINKSSGDEPDGGAGLIFDFPYNANAEPAAQQKSAVVNLFYINNMMHDITYLYGFDEPSGNFQKKNYIYGAGANDDVQAEAQDASVGTAASPSATNNANFSTPPDGQIGRMQMYLWTNNASKLLHITAPAIVKNDYNTGSAAFGTTIDANTKVSGDVIIASSGSGTDGCTIPTNDLTGKIAIVDRGICYFSEKAYNVQQKGAIGVIICNLEEGTIGMAGATNASLVKIPVVMISKSDCEKIRVIAGSGLKASIYLDASLSTGPQMLDGDFDNGIMAHEYTHGISTRLTGGRLNSSCLINGEQMGEGWSDFLALLVTATPADAATRTRGLGTYALYQKPTDKGIRRYPYSTDLAKNPLTYDDVIINSEVHDIGEVWCVALWDLYWKMIDIYGYKADLSDKTSGNGKTLQLVLDAMKIQPCNPGFIDARDAILAADKADFGGANGCLISSVFARRGMGANASQGTATDASDNTQNFDNAPLCVKTLKIQKTATETIKPGDIITYTLKVINHKGLAATGVVITDEIPANTTYVTGSASKNVVVSGNTLQWQIGTMQFLDTIVLTYKAKSDATKKSTAYFFDDFEKGDKNWDYEVLKGAGIWEVLDLYSYSGKNSMTASYPSIGAADFTTKTLKTIRVTGAKPTLRFFHRYQTEPGADGGIVQISSNNGTTWDNIDTKLFKNGYRGTIAYQTFVLPNLQAYWGDNKTFVSSCADLSSYIGKDIKVRFRFANDSLITGLGWFVDDVTIMDMVNYNGKASLVSAQGDTASVSLAQGGTIVDPTVFTPTSNINDEVKLNVYPNPTTGWLNLNIIGGAANSLQASIISIDGRTVWQNTSKINAQTETLIPVDMSAFSSGVYFVRLETDSKTIVEKIIKQ